MWLQRQLNCRLVYFVMRARVLSLSFHTSPHLLSLARALYVARCRALSSRARLLAPPGAQCVCCMAWPHTRSRACGLACNGTVVYQEISVHVCAHMRTDTDIHARARTSLSHSLFGMC